MNDVVSASSPSKFTCSQSNATTQINKVMMMSSMRHFKEAFSLTDKSVTR
jgi:hypothetical protein